jgi:ferritin
MSINIIDYLDEAIRLEYKVSELYHLFSVTFNEDKDFWWQIEIEEKNHAALLKSGKDFFEYGNFPETLFPENIEELKDSVVKVISIIGSFNAGWTRKKAFDTAIEIENLAGELHFQNFMHSIDPSDIADIFRRLNRDDCNHSQRLMEYKLKNGI